MKLIGIGLLPLTYRLFIMEVKTSSVKKIKLKQADWPLCSKKNTKKCLSPNITKKLPHPKLTVLPIPNYRKASKIPDHGDLLSNKNGLVLKQRTKRILEDQIIKFPNDLKIDHSSSEIHVCSTCKEEITDISRVLIMRDRDFGPRLLCFHFFSPCWSLELLCLQYPVLIIDKLGFSIPEKIKLKESSIIELQENIEFWN